MREIDTLTFYMAAIIVGLVFVAGLMIGWAYTKMLNDDTANRINDLSSKLGLLQAVSQSNTEQFCSLFNYLLPKLEESSWRLGEKIDYLENQGRVDNNLKNMYLEYLYRDYLILKAGIDKCNYTTEYLIYFYYNNLSSPCEQCYYQGFELSEARAKLRSKGIMIRIYSFDGKLEGLGRYLAQLYNITDYPTIIYRDKRLVGLVSSDKIVEMIEHELQG